MSTQRLQTLNNQFAATKPAKLPVKEYDVHEHFNSFVGKNSAAADARKGERFVTAWSYLGMDEYLTSRGKVMRDQVREFMARINPEVSSIDQYC